MNLVCFILLLTASVTKGEWLGKKIKWKQELGLFFGTRINACGQSLYDATSVHHMSFERTIKVVETSEYLAKSHAGLFVRVIVRQKIKSKCNLFYGVQCQVETQDFIYGRFLKTLGLDLRFGFLNLDLKIFSTDLQAVTI